MRRNTSDGRSDRRTVGRRLGLVLGMLSVSLTVRLSGQELANNSGALFLLFPVGAQAVAMGQTAATLDGRGEAAFWNPAGLATLEHSEFALNTASLAAGATHALTAYYPSHGFGVLGGAVYLVDYGDLERTDSADNTVARIAPRNRRVGARGAARSQGRRGRGQPVGELWGLGDARGHRRRLPAAAPAARRIRVRPGRALRAERRHGRDDRLDRRGPGACFPHGLGPGRPESDLFLLPRGVLKCAASPARCCSRQPWCRGGAPPWARCPMRARLRPPPRPRRPRRAAPRPGCGPRHRLYSPAPDSWPPARTVAWCSSRSSCTRSRASFS